MERFIVVLKKILISTFIICFVIIGVGAYFFSVDNAKIVNVVDINQFELRISTKAKLNAFIKGGYYNLYLDLLDKGHTSYEALDYISEGLGEKVMTYAKDNSIEPCNAQLVFTKDYDEPFRYSEGKEGSKVDLAKLQEDVVKSLDTKDAIELNFIIIQPEKTCEDLRNETTLRAEFSTNYSSSSANRKNNIKKAAEYLNGHIIDAENIMSFNGVVGKRTIERGFKSADIIFQGKMVKGVGGGVCQVSSTMYNTGLLAGLDAISSSRHSRKVFYLPASRDAMVSDDTDLVLSNPTSFPVFILAKATGDELKIAIYGIKTNLRYEIESEVLNIISPAKDKIIVEGENISPYIKDALESDNPERLKNIAYKEIRIKKSRAGIESQAYLYIYDENILLEKTLISHDMYYPQQGEVIRSII